MTAKTFVPRPRCTVMSGGCFTAGHCIGGCSANSMTKPTQRRAPTPLRAESIGTPVELSSLAALLLRQHQQAQPPALRLIVNPAPDDQPSRPVPAIEQGP